MPNNYVRFLEALNNIVHANGPYKDKVSALLAECGPDDRVNLEEFSSWLSELFPEENNITSEGDVGEKE